ncbi:MAG: carbohydrate ABC transporter permease [Nitrososphaerota archaeon]
MKIIYTIIALLISFLFISPILWIGVISVKPTDLIFSEVISLTFFPTIEHYSNVLSSQFVTYLLNSLLVALFNIALVLLISIPAAYAVSRLRVGRKNFMFWLLTLRMTPPIVFSIPIFVIFQLIGLLDNLLSLVLVYSIFNVPLAVWFFTTFINAIPHEVEEAAFIDGCDIYNLWLRILIPIIMPAIVSISILSFIAAWNEYLFALILTITKSRTWTIGSQIFVGTYRVQWGELAAAGIIGVIPPILLLFIIKERLIQGLTLGRLRG